MNIKIKINVKQIDKSRLYEGQKGTYLNCVCIEQANEYSDGFIVQEVTAEERARGDKGPIIGNFNYIRPKQADPEQQPSAPVQQARPIQDDLPF